MNLKKPLFAYNKVIFVYLLLFYALNCVSKWGCPVWPQERNPVEHEWNIYGLAFKNDLLHQRWTYKSHKIIIISLFDEKSGWLLCVGWCCCEDPGVHAFTVGPTRLPITQYHSSPPTPLSLCVCLSVCLSVGVCVSVCAVLQVHVTVRVGVYCCWLLYVCVCLNKPIFVDISRLVYCATFVADSWEMRYSPRSRHCHALTHWTVHTGNTDCRHFTIVGRDMLVLCI